MREEVTENERPLTAAMRRVLANWRRSGGLRTYFFAEMRPDELALARGLVRRGLARWLDYGWDVGQLVRTKYGELRSTQIIGEDLQACLEDNSDDDAGGFRC